MLTNSTSFDDVTVRLITENQTMLRTYCALLVHDPWLAEEVLSDVNLAILNAWDHYDPELPFEPWARGFVRRTAMAAMRKRHQEPQFLGEEALEQIGVEMDVWTEEPEVDQRKVALAGCIRQLQPNHAELIYERYFAARSYSEISDKVGRTVDNLWVTFNRLHSALGTCILNHLGRLENQTSPNQE